MSIEMIAWKLHLRFLYITLIMSERKISHKINLFDIITTIYKIEILNPIQNGVAKKPPYQFSPSNFYKRRN